MLQVERTIAIQAGVEVVWELFSRQEGMRQWFEPDLEIDVRVGGKFRHIDKDTNTLITGEVLEIESMRRISMTWFEDGPDTDWVNPIRFTFYLEEFPEGTLVKFVKEGFEQIGKPAWMRTYEAYERGAERHKLLDRLKAAAESRHVR